MNRTINIVCVLAVIAVFVILVMNGSDVLAVQDPRIYGN